MNSLPFHSENNNKKCSVIISVYKDVENLACILDALAQQTHPANEIIISEDGQDVEMARFAAQAKERFPGLKHLTQQDRGFRKNRALNRAIQVASNELLIFIDGDCVPHKQFIEEHLNNSNPGVITVGRRAEIGPFFSSLIKNKKWFRRILHNKFLYLLLVIPMSIDKGKNIEAGIYSPVINYFIKSKKIGMLGCNFSIYKNNLLKINGFDEQYEKPGIGEDSDVEWRLQQAGLDNINIKYLAIQYHLYHQSKYMQSQLNRDIFEITRNNNIIYCKKGIVDS